MNVGDKVSGSQFYGKRNKLTGTITHIEEVTYLPQSGYRGRDIVTISWNNRIVARFHRENIHYPLLRGQGNA